MERLAKNKLVSILDGTQEGARRGAMHLGKVLTCIRSIVRFTDGAWGRQSVKENLIPG